MKIIWQYLALGLLPGLLAATDMSAATVTVTNTTDSGAGSLRQAINSASSGDTIIFDGSLSGATISLTNGPLFISKNLIIDSSGLTNGVKLNGNNASRIFEFTTSTSALTGLTLTNGASVGGHPDDFGGAIYLTISTLTMSNCSFVGNQAIYGGAIYNEDSTLTIHNSTLAWNSAGAWGGGIVNDGGKVTVNNSTLTGNSAWDGGGVTTINTVAFTFNNSALVGNLASNNGGGIYIISGELNLLNSTLTCNSASNGAGIMSAPNCVLRLNNSTLVNNSATNFGGGIYNNSGTVNLTNSIVAGNTAAIDPNIFGSSFGSHSLTNSNPMLASLDNYGGPTQTMPPLPGSPAIDNGNDSVTNFLATDQRGAARWAGAHVDIGAVEGVFNPDFPLINATQFVDNSFQFRFENLSGANFRVLATTNIRLPLSNWTMIGFPPETPAGSGEFQFTDMEATNHPTRFYRVRFP